MRDKTLLLMIIFSASLMLLVYMSEGSTTETSSHMESESEPVAMMGGDVVEEGGEGCAAPVECVQDTSEKINELNHEMSVLAVEVYEMHQMEMLTKGVDVAK